MSTCSESRAFCSAHFDLSFTYSDAGIHTPLPGSKRNRNQNNTSEPRGAAERFWGCNYIPDLSPEERLRAEDLLANFEMNTEGINGFEELFEQTRVLQRHSVEDMSLRVQLTTFPWLEEVKDFFFQRSVYILPYIYHMVCNVELEQTYCPSKICCYLCHRSKLQIHTTYLSVWSKSLLDTIE